MLTAQEKQRVYRHAYLPEHLSDYVEIVSGAEPYLYEDYLCFYNNNHLVFVGYPLTEHAPAAKTAFQGLKKRFKPRSASIIAPQRWHPGPPRKEDVVDNYFQLRLPAGKMPVAISYMVRRGGKELEISRGQFTDTHHQMIETFMANRPLSPSYRRLFRRISGYLEQSPSAILLDAKKGRTPVAFTVMDVGSADYAFYLFNFRSLKNHVPGASDLLFQEMVKIARQRGKQAINLGLGINKGIRRFKEKWGGEPFLPYHAWEVRGKRFDFQMLMQAWRKA
jgi:hypothetical protein